MLYSFHDSCWGEEGWGWSRVGIKELVTSSIWTIIQQAPAPPVDIGSRRPGKVEVGRFCLP